MEQHTKPGRRRLLAAVALTLAAPLVLGSLGTGSNLDARMLAAHNRERAQLGVPPLRWNPALAADAAAWARDLASRGVMEHYDGDDADQQGENLAMGTAGAYSAEALIDLWIDEKAHFHPGTFPDNSGTGNWEDVAHYTQLVWADTGQLGCAVAQGRTDDFLVCRYAMAGNVMGERPF